MNEQDAFHKNSIEDASPAGKSGGLLEEMNLPPKVIAFIHNNSKQLQIVGICLVVAILGWIFADNYMERQKDKGAYALYSAMESDPENRMQALQNVKNDFSGTTSTWSFLEMAHLDFSNARYDDALQKYQTALDDMDSDSPIKPLVLWNMAMTLEQNGDINSALTQYKSVAEMGDFDLLVYPALARIYAALGNRGEALKAYEQLLEAVKAAGNDPSEIAFIEAKISSLPASAQ